MLKIFLTVGTNQYDFNRIFEIAKRYLEEIDLDYELLIQYGYSEKSRIPFTNSEKIKIVSMLSREEAENAYKEADLIFSHSGVGSIYNSLAYNRPTVLVPRLSKYDEFSDDHQLQIANEVSTNELILFVEDNSDVADFKAFLQRTRYFEKKPVNLVNDALAKKMKSIIYANNPNKSVLVVASAGGHITEAICAMSKLKSYSLVTTLTDTVNISAEEVFVVKRSQFNPIKYVINTIKAVNILAKVKPGAIFSTGGPICLPYALLARLLGIQFIYLDTLSRVTELSNTAKFLNRFKLTRNIYCQWQTVENKHPNIKNYGKVFKI